MQRDSPQLQGLVRQDVTSGATEQPRGSGASGGLQGVFAVGGHIGNRIRVVECLLGHYIVSGEMSGDEEVAVGFGQGEGFRIVVVAANWRSWGGRVRGGTGAICGTCCKHR